MIHLIYILAFTTIAFFAVSNLIRSLIAVSRDAQRYSPVSNNRSLDRTSSPKPLRTKLHPELLDEQGKPIEEPLLVVRSLTVEDAREQLDAIYNASPSNPKNTEENQEL